MVHSIAILALAGAAFSLPLASLPIGVPSNPSGSPSIPSGSPSIPSAPASAPDFLKALAPVLAVGASANGGPFGVRDLLAAVAPVEAAGNGVVTAAVPVAAAVDANVAQVGIENSNIGDNIGNNNNVNVLRSMKRDDLADVEATLYAIINAFVKVLVNAGVDVQAVIGQVTLQNDQILTNILNNNSIHVARSAPVAYVLADVEAAIRVLAQLLVTVDVPVQASLLAIGVSYDDIANGDLNYNNVQLASRDVADVTAVVDAIVQALVDACASVGVDIFAEVATLDVKDASILNNLLNGNQVQILRRQAVASVVADLVAIITVLVDALVNVNANIVATLLQIGIDCTSILSNILNGNNISILHRASPAGGFVSLAAFVQALIEAVLNVDAQVAAQILQVALQNDNVGTNILNNNVIGIL